MYCLHCLGPAHLKVADGCNFPLASLPTKQETATTSLMEHPPGCPPPSQAQQQQMRNAVMAAAAAAAEAGFYNNNSCNGDRARLFAKNGQNAAAAAGQNSSKPVREWYV